MIMIIMIIVLTIIIVIVIMMEGIRVPLEGPVPRRALEEAAPWMGARPAFII